jgi:HemY protein
VLLVLLITLVIAAMTFDDNGYVFVEFSGWIIEMNLWSLCLSFIGIFVGLLLLNLLIKFILTATSGSKNWLGNWGRRKKQQAFTNGLIALAESDYLKAREHLSKVESEDFDGINLLASAEVEVQLGEAQQAKHFWNKASKHKKSALAANICLIRADLHEHQPEKALELIKALTEKQQSQVLIIKLWAQALAEAGKWQILQAKLKGWKKAIGTDYDLLMLGASRGYFAEIASKEGAAQLKQTWQALPRNTRKDPAQQAAYIQQLIEQGMFADAELALVEYQPSGPVPLLLPLFKQIKLPNPTNAIKRLESWLKKDDLNVELLSALGHIAFNAQDKQLAEKALAKAIKLENRQEDLLLMAIIKESKNEQNQALELYKYCLIQQKAANKHP